MALTVALIALAFLLGSIPATILLLDVKHVALTAVQVVMVIAVTGVRPDAELDVVPRVVIHVIHHALVAVEDADLDALAVAVQHVLHVVRMIVTMLALKHALALVAER